MADEAARWRLALGFDILVKSWGEQAVVYHCGSGDTYLLDGLTTQVLSQLRQAPATTAELAREFLPPQDSGGDTRTRYLARVLDTLENLYVIEREDA